MKLCRKLKENIQGKHFDAPVLRRISSKTQIRHSMPDLYHADEESWMMRNHFFFDFGYLGRRRHQYDKGEYIILCFYGDRHGKVYIKK